MLRKQYQIDREFSLILELSGRMEEQMAIIDRLLCGLPKAALRERELFQLIEIDLSKRYPWISHKKAIRRASYESLTASGIKQLSDFKNECISSPLFHTKPFSKYEAIPPQCVSGSSTVQTKSLPKVSIANQQRTVRPLFKS